MTALRFMISLPFRLVMLIGGAVSVVFCAVSVAFLVVGAGAQIIAESFGRDRS